MSDDQRLLEAFQATDERGQQRILMHALSTAKTYPAPYGALCGVVGGVAPTYPEGKL